MDLPILKDYSFFPNFLLNSLSSLKAVGDDPCATPQTQAACNWIQIDGYVIPQPSFIPCCLATLILGLWTSRIVRARKLKGYFYYSLAFKFAAIMMTCSCLVNCLLYWIAKKIIHIYIVILVTDETLTSTIALTFFFGALVDMDCITDKSKCARIVYYLMILLLLGAWIY